MTDPERSETAPYVVVSVWDTGHWWYARLDDPDGVDFPVEDRVSDWLVGQGPTIAEAIASGVRLARLWAPCYRGEGET